MRVSPTDEIRSGGAEGTMTTVELRIVGRKLPGRRFGDYRAVHVGLGRGATLRDLTPGDAPEAIFHVPLTVVTDREGRQSFRGPFVQGKRGERFVYLSWGEVGSDGQFQLFRAAKVHLATIPAANLARALETGARIEAVLDLTDVRGGPVCASVRPPWLTWSVV